MPSANPRVRVTDTQETARASKKHRQDCPSPEGIPDALRALLDELSTTTLQHRESQRDTRKLGARVKALSQEITPQMLALGLRFVQLDKGAITVVSSVKLFFDGS